MDTLRAVHGKDDYIGYIFRLKGIDTFINGGSSFLIAMETDFAERRFHDTRLDGSDFDVAVYDFDTDQPDEVNRLIEKFIGEVDGKNLAKSKKTILYEA